MANPNQILPFATGVGANVEAPGTLASLTEMQQGFQAGTANSTKINSVLRQSSFAAAMVAQFTADFGPAAVNDDGNVANFEANFVAALRGIFVGIPDLTDVGSANQIVINPTQPAAAYAVPMIYIVKCFATSTGPVTVNVSGLGPKPLTRISQAQLLPGDIIANGKILIAWDGTRFQLLSSPGTTPGVPQVIHYGRDVSGTPGRVIVAVDPAVTLYAEPLWFGVYIASNNTGAATLNVNTLGDIPITRGAGTALTAGDLVGGTIAYMCFDGTEAQLINPQQLGASGSGAPADWNDINGQLRPYWLAVNSAVVGSPPGSPAAGDAYIIPTSPAPTGSWTGLAGKIAQWTGTAWVYRVFPAASIIGTSDTLRYYQRVGTAWVEIQLPTLGKLFFYAQL